MVGKFQTAKQVSTAFKFPKDIFFEEGKLIMKKTLAAVAVLGAFAGSAFAADVTLYGRIDAGLLYQHQDADMGEAATDSWGLESGNMTGSRFGVKGSEQITDDIKVSFTLENGFKSDSGNFGTSSKFFDREASLRVTTAYGEIGVGRMGRILSDAGTYGQRGQFILGSSWGGFTGGTEMISDATSSRLDNMITYKSPEFAGVTVLAQYGMGDQGSENTSSTDRYYGIAAVGHWGALSGMLGFEQTNYKSSFAKSAATFDTEELDDFIAGLGEGDIVDLSQFKGHVYVDTPAKAARAEDQDDSIGIEASVAYDFGFVKTAMTARYFKDGNDVNAINSEYEDVLGRIDGYGVKLAAAAPVLGGTVQGMVGYMDAETAEATLEDDMDFKRYTVALTYQYPLSKRTVLYTAASYTKDEYKDNVAGEGEQSKYEPTNTSFMFGMAHYF